MAIMNSNPSNIPYLNSQNPFSHSKTGKFSFLVFVGIYQRMEFCEKEIVLSTSTRFFKPLIPMFSGNR